MYVDASGDDGFKFEKDSTICYATAALLVKQEDIPYNSEILRQIKKIVGCKDTDEVKYSVIRRHRRSQEVFPMLQDIKGKLSSYVIFKKEIPVEKSPQNGDKTLSAMCHLMAIHSLDYYPFNDGDKVLVAIDHMKHTEEMPVKRQMYLGVLSDQQKPNRKFSTTTTFKDSKDAQFLLIQIADLLCGILREHFEQYEIQEDMIYFSSKCPPCEKLRLLKRGKGVASHPLCKNGRSRTEKILCSQKLKHIFHLFPISGSLEMVRYCFMEPAHMVDEHFYMICSKKK